MFSRKLHLGLFRLQFIAGYNWTQNRCTLDYRCVEKLKRPAWLWRAAVWSKLSAEVAGAWGFCASGGEAPALVYGPTFLLEQAPAHGRASRDACAAAQAHDQVE